MTPRRRQGSGRAAIDHIAAQLTDALSELSRVQASQAAIAVANDRDRLEALLDRLDTPLLEAVTAAAGHVHDAAQHVLIVRHATEGTSP